jgi:GNAT superfamily N-acetyltransferase
MSKPLWDIDSGVPGVRLATKADEGEIFALLLLLHAENGIFSLNPNKVIQGIQWATDRQGGIIFVIEKDHRVVASLGMLVTSDWYTDDEYLLERWNYVHPEHRKSDYARRLLEQAQWTHQWFKRNGKVLPFQCGINSFDRTEAKVRLYARHMACIGAFFMYGLPPRQAEKMQEEMRRIEELNKLNRRRPMEEQRARPVVETILRVGREANHVR